MSLKNRLLGMHWTLTQKWFGLWEVRNYYTMLEQRAKAGAELDFGYVLMVLAAGILATSGLLLNSTAVIIGSMCVAPFLGPSRAVCIGALFRNRKVFVGGLIKQLLGLLVLGAGLAFGITKFMRASVPGVGITQEILLRAMPDARYVVLSVLVALAAGAAASLALAADPRVVQTAWGQVIDAVIGVEISVSLLPPASVVGIGLALGQPALARDALLLLLVNVVGLDIIGSTLMLALRGVRAHHLELEKSIRQAVEWTLAACSSVTPVGSSIDVILLAPKAANVLITARSAMGEEWPDALAQTIAKRILEETGCRSEVTLQLIPHETYSTL
jgi:uncharacterized hydrophobic protein (TIGR00271 family)